MAKDKKNMTPEEKAKEKERLARIKKEEKELKKRLKEKDKRKKDREKKRTSRENLEKKRIRGILNFPFKTLFLVSSLLSMIAFVMMFFGGKIDIIKAIYISTLVFTFLFLSVGIIMIGGFFVVSQEKISEIKKNKQKEDKQEKDRLKKEEQELEDLLQAEMQVLGREKSRSQTSQEPILLEGALSEDFGLNVDKSTSPSLEEPPSPPSPPLPPLEEELSGPVDMFNDEDFSSKDEQSDNKNTENTEQIDSQELNEDADELPQIKETEDDESFFSENDFMDELVFGSEQKEN
jgi:hypothetical protein